MFSNNFWSSVITVGITKFLIYVAFASLTCFIVVYKWKHRHLEKLAAQLPGLPALPILGNALELRGSPEEVVNRLLSLAKQFTSLSRIWFGHYLIIYVPKHEDIQKILNSSKNLSKPYLYRFLYPVVGNGLLTAPVHVWHTHRRAIAPAFNTKMLEQFVPVFGKYSKLLVDKLRPQTSCGQFNIGKYIHSITLDTICETAFGVDEWTPYTIKSDFAEGLLRISDILHKRIFKLWMHFDLIFNQIYGSQFKVAVQKFLRLPNMILEEKMKEYKLKKVHDAKEDDAEENDGRKIKLRAFIDILLELVESGEIFTADEVRDEAATMIIANSTVSIVPMETTLYVQSASGLGSYTEYNLLQGHDTTAETVSFCVLMMAIHQDIQKNVYEEVVGIFGNPNRKLTIEDLKQMIYTEMVIKETLRLYPSVPLFLREIEEDVKLTSHTLPAGCSVLISPKAIHMDPKVYPNPDQFNPENFTSESIAKRHRCSYLPFSTGPRSCLGQIYAMLSMKTTVAYLVRNFRFFTDIQMSDIKLKNDFLLRSAIGFPVKIVARKHLEKLG